MFENLAFDTELIFLRQMQINESGERVATFDPHPLCPSASAPSAELRGTKHFSKMLTSCGFISIPIILSFLEELTKVNFWISKVADATWEGGHFCSRMFFFSVLLVLDSFCSKWLTEISVFACGTAAGDLTVSLPDGLTTLDGIQLQLTPANLVCPGVQISGIDPTNINNITLQVKPITELSGLDQTGLR